MKISKMSWIYSKIIRKIKIFNQNFVIVSKIDKNFEWIVDISRVKSFYSLPMPSFQFFPETPSIYVAIFTKSTFFCKLKHIQHLQLFLCVYAKFHWVLSHENSINGSKSSIIYSSYPTSKKNSTLSCDSLTYSLSLTHKSFHPQQRVKIGTTL